MHYWRIDPHHWARCIHALRDLGLRLVETYVPWSVHEIADGTYDWSGPRDLGRFLDLVADAGLGAVLRPGPHCNAELTGFGYPDRVLRDGELLARTAHGTPVWLPAPPRAFPVPSYASARFLAEVGRWYAEVARVVAPRLAPDGPVVAFGVDNEAQMFFRLGAFDHDYHPDAVAAWHEIESGEPPRAWSDDPAAIETCIRWVRHKDAATARALGELAVLLDAAGLGGVARFHNLPPGEPLWYDLPQVGRAVGGPAGIDVYAGAAHLADVRRRALHLVGSAAPLPIVPELGVGFFPWLPPITGGEHDQRDVTLTLLGAGVRGMSFYMAVERERWYDGAITPEGDPGPAAHWIRALTAALDEIDFTSLRRHAEVAVVVSRADARFGLASSLVDPVTPVVAELLQLGPGGAAELGRDDAAIAHRRWLGVVQEALDLAQIPYALVDESCDAARLAGYRAVIAPTLDRIDAGLLATLRVLADHRQVVVLGPGTPTRDELGRPLADGALPRRVGMMRAESLDDMPGLADDLAEIVAPPEAWTVARGHGVDCMALAAPDGAVRALVVTNRSAKSHRAELRTPGALKVRDPFTGEVAHAAADTLPVALPPHAARLLVVE
jgi:beta-galactosidase